MNEESIFNPTSYQIEEMKAYFIKHPEEVPEEAIRARLLDEVSDENNQKLIMGGMETAEYINADPVHALRARLVVENYARANKLRLVDDKPISASIREARKRQKNNFKRGFFSRVFRSAVNADAAEYTELIKRYEDLAAEVVALETYKLQLKKETDEAKKYTANITEAAEKRAEALIADAKIKASDILQKAEEVQREAEPRARKILNETSEKCQSILNKAAEGASKIYSDVTVSADKIREEANLLQKDTANKLGYANNVLRQNIQELTEKRALLAELDKNPLIKEEWAKRSKGDSAEQIEDEQELIKNLEHLHLKMYSGSEKSDFATRINYEDWCDLFCHTKEIMIHIRNFLLCVEAFEGKYGKNTSMSFVHCMDNKWRSITINKNLWASIKVKVGSYSLIVAVNYGEILEHFLNKLMDGVICSICISEMDNLFSDFMLNYKVQTAKKALEPFIKMGVCYNASNYNAKLRLDELEKMPLWIEAKKSVEAKSLANSAPLVNATMADLALLEGGNRIRDKENIESPLDEFFEGES